MNQAPTYPVPAGEILRAGLVFSGPPALAALSWLHWRGCSEALAELVIGGELFFRLAVLGCCGLAASVAIRALVHSSIGGLRLPSYLCLCALMPGGLMQAGLGPLGSTLANPS